MDQQPRRGQRLRQAPGQARLIRQCPQQHQASVRHDSLTARSNVQAPRPPGSVHLESAPRSEVDKGFSTLILPAQEHFLLLARRSGTHAR